MFNLICLLFLTNTAVGNVSDDYIDPVIDLLLNGGNSENQSFEEEGNAPTLINGIWKCGNCSDINDSKLLYSENNDVDIDMDDDDVDIQISLTLPGMRCVIVAADKPGLVKKLSGACDTETVTLHVSPSRHFTVNVYN